MGDELIRLFQYLLFTILIFLIVSCTDDSVSNTGSDNLPPIYDVRAIVDSETQISLYWKDSTSLYTGYDVYESAGESEEFALNYRVLKPADSLIIPELSPNTDYAFYVIGFNEDEYSGSSNIVRVSTSHVIPTAPDSLKAIVVDRKNIHLSWIDKSANEDGFNIYQRKGDEQDFQLVTQVHTNVSTVTIEDLESLVHYSYRVNAFNDYGHSAPLRVDSLYTLYTGTMAYVGNSHGGITLIDVSDPQEPKYISSINLPNRTEGIAYSENLIFAACREAGLFVIDVADSRNPMRLTSFNIPGANRVEVSGRYAYVASGDRLTVLDFSNHNDIYIAGFVNAGASYLTLSEQYAFVTDGSGQLMKIDIGDPEQPRIYQYYQDRNMVYRGLSITDIADDGTFLCIASDGRNDFGVLQIFDISQPNLMNYTGVNRTLLSAIEIATANNYAFLTTGSVGLSIFLLGEPVNPRYVTSYSTAGNVFDLTIIADYAYLSIRQQGLQILDVSDPEAITEIGRYTQPLDGSGLVIVDY